MDFTEDVGEPDGLGTQRLAELLEASPADASNADEIGRLGELIDLADALSNVEALRVAVARGDQLLTHDLSQNERLTVHYCLGNAWDGLRRHIESGPEGAWDKPERGQQIVHLRKAVRLIDAHKRTGDDDENIEPVRCCQVIHESGQPAG